MADLYGWLHKELSGQQEHDLNYIPFMSEKYKKEISEILKKCEEGSTDKLKKRELSKIWKYKLLNKEYEWLFNNFEIFNKIPDLQDKIIDSCIEKKLFYTMFKNIDKIESYEKYIVEKVGQSEDLRIWNSITGDICKFLERKRSSYRKSRDVIINYFFMDEVEKQEKLKKFTEFFEFIKNYEFFSNLITIEKRSRLLAKANSVNNKRGSSSTRKAYNNKRTHDKILDNYFYRLALRT